MATNLHGSSHRPRAVGFRLRNRKSFIYEIPYGLRNKERNNMNKTELVEAIAKKADLSKKDAEAALKAFTETVGAQLKKGDKIQLVGFGTFEVAKRAARTGKNPQTGAAIKIPASKAPKFKAGKALKDLVNKK